VRTAARLAATKLPESSFHVAAKELVAAGRVVKHTSGRSVEYARIEPCP
jgi:hypothetical protein